MDQRQNGNRHQGKNEPNQTRRQKRSVNDMPRVTAQNFTRWFKIERLSESDDFFYRAAQTAHMFQSGHLIACWKAL